MDTARDLARADPWQKSAERSRARRGAARPSAPGPEPAARPDPAARPEPAAGPEPAARREPAAGPEPAARRERAARGERWLEFASSVHAWCEHAVAAARSSAPSLGPKSVAALALFAAIVASSLASGGPQNSPSPARADVPQAGSAQSGSLGATSGSGAAAPAGWADCPLAVTPQGYVNPLSGASLKPERIDQGVDYAGSGTLAAIGAARVTYLATSNSGWPGAFIEYQLLDGADAGCYVFYAEGVVPADGLYVGETVSAGQPLATIIPKWPTGIEIGWGAGRGTKTYAKVAGQWSGSDDQNNVASAAGQNFSALIAALGGPPGKLEG